MRLRLSLARPLPLALVTAVALVGGSLAGTAAYETSHPRPDRLVWIERDPIHPDADRVVRRALFADGRFLALTPNGYQAGILEPALTDEIFTTVSTGAGAWADEFDSPALLGELIDLELGGIGARRVRIENPATNYALPPTLARILLLFAAADRQIATVSFAPSALRFRAVAVADAGGSPVDELPTSFPLQAAASGFGTVIAGADLAVLMSVWNDLAQRLGPELSHRFVKSGDQLWRLAWTLDLDGVGSASSKVPGPAK
jgi:hypothetical protein